jgi:hypothetical protein
MSRAIWILAAVACSGRPAPPPPAMPVAAPVIDAAVADAAVPADAAALEQDLPRLAERSLAMYRDVADALAASGVDCGAAITKLRAMTAGYRDVVGANAKVLRDGRAAELRAALAPHNDAFDGAARAIMESPTMSACAPDPAFARAFEDLLEPPP